MTEIPVLILLGVKTNISPPENKPYPVSQKEMWSSKPYVSGVFAVSFGEGKHVNTPANGPEPTLRKSITVILPDKFWGKNHVLVPSVWIVCKLTSVFPSPHKKNRPNKW